MTWIDDNQSLIDADNVEASYVQRFCIQQPSAGLVTLAKKVVAEQPDDTIHGIIDYYRRNNSLSRRQRQCLAQYVGEGFYMLDSGDVD